MSGQPINQKQIYEEMYHTEANFRLKANDVNMMNLSFDKSDKMSTHQST